MKETFGWAAKHVILPLTPFFIVAIFRFTFQGLDWAILDSKLLSFSMAMLCLLVAHDASKLRDPNEKNGIYYSFTSLMVIFLALSVGVSILEIQNQNDVVKNLKNFNNALQSGKDDSTSVLQVMENTTAETSYRIMILRWITLVLSCGTIFFAIMFKQKYKLED